MKDIQQLQHVIKLLLTNISHEHKKVTVKENTKKEHQRSQIKKHIMPERVISLTQYKYI